MVENLPEKLRTIRHGISFASCLDQCAQEPELVSNLDRLHGTNLLLKGSSFELAIDQASGRLNSDLEQFVEFCWECVFQRFGK